MYTAFPIFEASQSHGFWFFFQKEQNLKMLVFRREGVFTMGFVDSVLFFLKKEPKTLALRGFN
jgi:hypothetical protein